MNLIGKSVKHKMFGVGEVIAQSESSLEIAFPKVGVKKLPYNIDTFSKFLEAEDPEVQTDILDEFQKAKDAKLKSLLDRVQAKPSVEIVKKEAVARPYKSNAASKKSAVKRDRVPGQRMTFYVFQGATFDRESKGGYIWAPISSKDGGMPHHWTRLIEVQPGDVIFHGCNAHVQAISVARESCYECSQPAELRTEDLWEQEGRRVDCEYFVLDHPIKISYYKDDILRLCNVKYAPFDKDGNGNMGYLYELDRELAQVFLHGIVKYNPDAADIDVVAELLELN